MGFKFDVHLRLAPEVRAWMRAADRLINERRESGLPEGEQPPAGLPRDLADWLLRLNRSTGLLFTDTAEGIRIRSAVGGGSIDAVVEILRAAEARFGREAVQHGNEPALAEMLLRPLLEVAAPETLRDAQDRIEQQPGARVSFTSLYAGDLIGGAETELGQATLVDAQASLLEARRGLLSVGRTGKPAMAVGAALDVARRGARAELENRLEEQDPEEDESPSA